MSIPVIRSDEVLLSFLKQPHRGYPESICNAPESADRGVSRAAFEITEIASLKACAKCDLLLGETDLVSDRSHVFSELGDNVHRHSRVRLRDRRCPLNVSFSMFR